MCNCSPEIKAPFCGRPGCEWPKASDVPMLLGQLRAVSGDEWIVRACRKAADHLQLATMVREQQARSVIAAKEALGRAGLRLWDVKDIADGIDKLAAQRGKAPEMQRRSAVVWAVRNRDGALHSPTMDEEEAARVAQIMNQQLVPLVEELEPTYNNIEDRTHV